jgi:hypothetical protein
MEIAFVVIVVSVAVWYLVRRLLRTIKAEQPSCGCSGCDGCAAAPKNAHKESIER